MSLEVMPSAEVRATLASKITDLITAVETHPKWNPQSVDPGLFHIWDFVKRTDYMLSEIDNIREGKALKYPDQIKLESSDPDKAALGIMTDVFTRSTTIDQMVSGPPILMAMMGISVDVTPEIKNTSKAVVDALPQ